MHSRIGDCSIREGCSKYVLYNQSNKVKYSNGARQALTTCDDKLLTDINILYLTIKKHTKQIGLEAGTSFGGLGGAFAPPLI